MTRSSSRFSRGVCVAASVLVLNAACGGDESDSGSEATSTTTGSAVAISIASPSDGGVVKGNVVPLALKITGLSVVAADGDVSGQTGHIHAFIDREPVAPGALIPKEPGIIHSVDNPLKLSGMAAGKHLITVVVGDGAHKRIGNAQDRVSVTVEGPTVDAVAPATVAAGSPVRIDFKVAGVQIVKADGDVSGATAHFHVFVDKPLPASGDAIGKPDDESILHTAEPFIEIPSLPAGEHVLFVVLGDGTHTVLNPLVADKLTVTVA